MRAQALAPSSTFVVVEQLNRSQWHARSPLDGENGWSVQDYVASVADALWMAYRLGLGVETVDLDGNRMVLQWPEVVA